MKIGFDVSDLATGRADGTTRFTMEVAKRLPLINKDCEWLYFAPGDVSGLFALKSQNINFKVSPWLKGWTQMRLPGELYRFRPDRLFMPIQQLPYLRPGKTRTTAVVHDLAFHIYPEQFTNKDWALQHVFTAYACREADSIIAVSQATADDVGRYYGRTKNIHVIHHGLDHNQFKPPVTETEKTEAWKRLIAWQPNLRKPYILFVGQIQPRKNLIRLIEAFELMVLGEEFGERGTSSNMVADTAQYQLVIAGSHGWLNKPIYQRVASSRVANQILTPGRVPDDLLTYLYWHAEVFVLPSLYEGFGMPIVEAMGSGCPVVTSNVSSMPEVAGKAAVLIDPGSVKDIQSGIQQAIREKKNLIKRGLDRAKDFNWDGTAKSILAVLESDE